MSTKSCAECGNLLGLKRTSEGTFLCKICLEEQSTRRSDLQVHMELGHHVRDHVFLGSQMCAQDYDFLIKNNITKILVVGEGLECPFETNPRFTYSEIPVLDMQEEQIIKYFGKAFDFIDNRVNEFGDTTGNVLVHCVAGISRSATIVIAYLMRKYGMSYFEALNYVQQKRPIVDPNPGFVKQLQKYERQLRMEGVIKSKTGAVTWAAREWNDE